MSNNRTLNSPLVSRPGESEQSGYDPDLPNASAVMAAICCVSSQFAVNPSTDLAMLVSDLAHKLAAPQYAESQLIAEVAKRLVFQWDAIIDNLHDALLVANPPSGAIH